jgi:hypothetical protein
MKVGDLVRYDMDDLCVGVVTCIDPEELGDDGEVEVVWVGGAVSNHSTYFLEVINENK